MVSLRNLFEFFRMLFVTKIIINQEIGKDQKGKINEREVELQKYIYALKKKKRSKQNNIKRLISCIQRNYLESCHYIKEFLFHETWPISNLCSKRTLTT